MEKYNATYYSTEDYYNEDDFSMGEPNLPEARKKPPDWTLKITNIYTPNAGKLYVGASTMNSQVTGGNHEEI